MTLCLGAHPPRAPALTVATGGCVVSVVCASSARRESTGSLRQRSMWKLRRHQAMSATMAGVLALWGTHALAQAPLTLAEAQHRAVERSRQLVAQDSAIVASREMAVAA